MKDLNLIVMGLYPWLSILLLGLAGFMVFRQYRKLSFTGPERLRNLLMALRYTAWFFLIILLFQPVIQFSLNKKEKPIDYILLDNSLSLSLTRDFSGRRLIKRIQEWLESYQKLDHQKHLILFADKTTETTSESDFYLADFQGKNTRLTPTLEYILQKFPEENINNLIILTDGYLQDQAQVARILPDLPFKTILAGIGDTLGNPDLKITYVTHAPMAYLGDETPIIVRISAVSLASTPFQIRIEDDQSGESIANQTLTIPKSGTEMEIPLSIRPNKIGKHFYKARLSCSVPEIITQNNQFVFMIKVLKSKLRILTVWGVPDYDFKFLQQALSSEKNYQCENLVLSHPDARNAISRKLLSLNEYDVIILGHLLPQDLTVDQWAQLVQAMEEKHQPLIIFSGTGTRSVSTWGQTAFATLFSRLKPHIISDQYRASLQMIPDPTNSVTTFLDVRGSATDNLKYWSAMAPLNQAVILKENPVGVRILAYLRPPIQNDYRQFPAIWLDQQQGRKALIFLATPIWRHSFASLRDGDNNQTAQQVWIDMITFMVFLDDQNQIMINPIRSVFNDGEEVIFEGKAWNSTLVPARQDRYELVIYDSTGREIQSLKFTESAQSGLLSSSAGYLKPGKYAYQVTQYREDQAINQKKDEFLVTEYNLESDQIGQNLHFLREMDRHSLISYYNLNDTSSLLIDSLNHHIREIGLKKEISVWDTIWILSLLVLMWAVEWFIRQRNLML